MTSAADEVELELEVEDESSSESSSVSSEPLEAVKLLSLALSFSACVASLGIGMASIVSFAGKGFLSGIGGGGGRRLDGTLSRELVAGSACPEMASGTASLSTAGESTGSKAAAVGTSC